MSNEGKTKKQLIDELRGMRRRITELEKSEAERKQVDERISELSYAIDRSPGTILITDVKGNIKYVNYRFTEVSGYTREEVIGKNPGIFQSGKTPPEVYKKMWDTLNSGGEWRGEFVNKRKGGELYWESATISPIRNSGGVITGFIAAKEDITEQKHKEDLEKEKLKLSVEVAEHKKAEETLRSIATGVSAATGEAFFCLLVEHLAVALDVEYAFVGELKKEEKIKTLAIYAHGKIVDNFEYDLANTPCENVGKKGLCCYASGVQQQFSHAHLLADMGVESYAGISLLSSAGNAIGTLVVMDGKPLDNVELVKSMLIIFAIRAAAEMERQHMGQEQAQLASFPALNPDPVIEIDLDGTVTYLNLAARQQFPDLLTVGPEHPILKDVASVITILQSQERKNIVRETRLGNSVYEQHISYLAESRHLRSYLEDITERKRAEEEIHLLLTTTQAISESQDFNVGLGIAIRKVCETTGWSYGEAWVPSHDGKILEYSAAWYSSANSLQKFRKLSEEFTFPPNVGLPGRVWSSKQPEWIPDVSSQSEAVFLRAQIVLESGLKAGFGVPIITNGQVLAVLVFFMFKPRVEDNRLVELVSAVAIQLGSVIQHKLAEEKRQESEERYRALLNLGAEVGEAVIMLQDTEQGEAIPTFVSDEWLRITGYSRGELLSMSFFDLLRPRHRQASQERYQRRMQNEIIPGLFEMSIIRKDGTEVPIELTSAYTTYQGKRATVAFIRDITERKRMEEERSKMQEQLILTDRLASIGELASGIAHELNNPLTSVIGFSELLLDKDVPDDIKEDLRVINREAQRTAGIVRNLLTFARKHDTEKKPVDIHKAIQAVLELRAYEQKVSNIKVNTRFAPDLPEITADGFQLQQVFLNIIINAEYFMIEAHRRGTLTITTEWIGDIIRASFADDGPGVAEENLGHLFDPFFTTKEVGKGTGLGLSISYGIITEHGGRIYAESELGKGATFVIELPVAKKR